MSKNRHVIKRTFDYTYRIEAITTTEGGCDERTITDGIEDIGEAILLHEKWEKKKGGDPGFEYNTGYYLVVDYIEPKGD